MDVSVAIKELKSRATLPNNPADSEDMSDFIDDGDDGAEETFFFRPHTLSALALLLAAMFAVALSDTVRDLLPYSSSRLYGGTCEGSDADLSKGGH